MRMQNWKRFLGFGLAAPTMNLSLVLVSGLISGLVLTVGQTARSATVGWAQTTTLTNATLTGPAAANFIGTHLTSANDGEVATPSADPATAVDAQKWDGWLNYVMQTATPVEQSTGYFYTMTSLVPNDVTKTHIANYFSVVGWYDQQNKFAPSFISAVSENWKISANGTRDIDQWIFDVDLTGLVSHAEHMHLVETSENQVLVDDFLPTTPAIIATEWAKRMGAWYASQPAPTPSPSSTIELR